MPSGRQLAEGNGSSVAEGKNEVSRVPCLCPVTHKRGEPRGEAPLVVMVVREMTYSVVHSGLVKNQLEVSKSLL